MSVIPYLAATIASLIRFKEFPNQIKNMSKHIIFQDEDDYLKYCETHPDRTIVVYDDEVFDVTDFIDRHPGGADIIEEYNHNDITQLLHSSYPHAHSKGAIKTLKKYKIGHLKDEDEDPKPQEPEIIWNYPKVMGTRVEYKEAHMDLNKSLVSQIAMLNKKQYIHVIQNPIEYQNCRLFDNSLFEILTKHTMYFWALFWVIFMYDLLTQKEIISSNSIAILALLSGLLIWTFVEYLLHRYYFYREDNLSEAKSSLSLHFICYGKHRMIPSDTHKTTIPFPMSFLLLNFLRMLLIAVCSQGFGQLAFLGVLLGYTIYEILHSYYHSGNPGNGYLKEMQKCHINCHNSKGKRCYGVTSKLWDKIFGTEVE